MRFLDECIILFVHANPDGNDLVADWYMRNPDPLKRSARGPAAALSEVHRPRQQPRLLRLDAGRDREHQPRAVPRVAAADSLQPPPERPGRDGRVVLAAARSLQLQPRPAADPRAAGARHAHAPAARRRRQAGRDDGVGRRLRRLVERRHPQHRQLPQHHRDPDRDDRQPDADADSARARSGRFPNRDLPYPIAPQEWRFRQSIDYSISFNRAVHRLRGAQPRAPALQHLRDGAARDRARQRGHLDAVADADAGGSPRRWAAAAAAAATPERDAALWAELRKPELPRSARLHHPVGPARLPRRRSSSSTRCARSTSPCSARRADFDAAGKTLSRRLVRRHDRAGVPAARDRHVRAAGSSRT